MGEAKRMSAEFNHKETHKKKKKKIAKIEGNSRIEFPSTLNGIGNYINASKCIRVCVYSFIHHFAYL